jgi:hypothetical protein
MALVRLARLEQLLGVGEILQAIRTGALPDVPPSSPQAAAGSRPVPIPEEKKKSMSLGRNPLAFR